MPKFRFSGTKYWCICLFAGICLDNALKTSELQEPYSTVTQNTQYYPKSSVQIPFISPIAHENTLKIKPEQGNAKVKSPGKPEEHTKQTLFPLREFTVEND